MTTVFINPDTPFVHVGFLESITDERHGRDVSCACQNRRSNRSSYIWTNFVNLAHQIAMTQYTHDPDSILIIGTDEIRNVRQCRMTGHRSLDARI